LVDIVITLVQGLTSIIYRTLPSSAFLLGLILLNSYFIILVTGTIFAMWLEKIDKGIGNGISL
jgi:preprotein translocase subunit SecY